MNLPYEITQNILLYLEFEQVFLIDNHIANKLYDPEKYKNYPNHKIINLGIEFIKWLGKNNKELPFRLSSRGSLISSAARYGRLDILKYLYENISLTKPYILDESCDRCIYGMATPMDIAAYFGHLDTVKWFHSIRANYTLNAMDDASADGHLEVIKYLHKIGAECTTMAMDNAAANGHLEVVKWLRENYEMFRLDH